MQFQMVNGDVLSATITKFRYDANDLVVYVTLKTAYFEREFSQFEFEDDAIWSYIEGLGVSSSFEASFQIWGELKLATIQQWVGELSIFYDVSDVKIEYLAFRECLNVSAKVKPAGDYAEFLKE